MDEDEKLGFFHAVVAVGALFTLAGLLLGGVYLLAEVLVWIAKGLT
jgi:hypothetical protein